MTKLKENMKAKLPYPKAVFLIVVTEFCERFSYYGMRAVLTIYMTTMLGFSDNTATTVYHTFLLLCYGLPLFWGILADSWLGKYKTIVFVSIVFALGNIVLTLSSVTPLHLPATPLTLLGLLLMSIGTAGMKPCVAPLGGDQFTLPQQDKQLQQYFSVFFFSVSVGNMLSTVVTPVLRKDVHCFGDHTCYPLAFGLPACLMIAAVVIFICGKRYYKINKPEGNIALNVARCVSYAVSQKAKRNKETDLKPHWLDYASDKFDAQLIHDVKGLLKVLVYYLSIPWFWSLYEQLGSRWTLQATRMTGVIGNGFYTIKPDQMQVCNAIMMFIFIPFFETVVYPLFKRCNLLKRPLQRMGVGGVLAALSFFVAGVVELQIQHTVATVPAAGETNLNFINTLPCPVSINGVGKFENSIVGSESNLLIYSIKESIVNLKVQINGTCAFGRESGVSILNREWQGQIQTFPSAVQSLVIGLSKGSVVIQSLHSKDDVKKSREGNAKLRIVYTDFNPESHHLRSNASFVDVELRNQQHEVPQDGKFLINAGANVVSSSTVQVEPDTYQIDFHWGYGAERTESNITNIVTDWVNLKTGGSYILVLHESYNGSIDLKDQMIILTPPNEVHMLWLMPQYILMAWAEVMFIISGMEFSYSEAPKSMKSVLQSCWHLTNAVGNIIVIISAQISFADSEATEFFVFAGLMAIDMVIFVFMATRYTYVSSEENEKTSDSPVTASATERFENSE